MPDSELIGQTIGSYRLEALLGQGGIGQIFRAHHVETGRLLALKLLRADLAGDPTFAERFRAQAQANAALRHPNIVETYDFGQQDGRAFLATEFMPGGSLRAVLQRGQALPLDVAIDLARQAADGLDFAHRQGVIHRNLKPENMLLGQGQAPREPTLKVGDFGLAQLAERSDTTATGVSVGTPTYMSPEQCQGLALDGRSDIYALGVVLFEAATGRPPFVANSVGEAVSAHVFTPPPSPHAARPDISPDLEAIVLRCLAKQPEGRFATAAELSRALAALPEMSSRQTTEAAAPPPDVTQIGQAPTLVPQPADIPAAVEPPPVDATEVGVPVPQLPIEVTEIAQAPTPPAAEEPVPLPAVVPIPPVPPIVPPVVPIALDAPVPPAQATPAGEAMVTRTLVRTPVPPLAALPPVSAVPQVQVLNAEGQQVMLLSLTGDGLAVGRAPGNDLQLDSESVSEEHAQVDWDGSEVSISDLDSKNGTLLDGRRIPAQAAQPWNWGSMLQIGPFWLRLVPPLAPPVTTVTPTPPFVVPPVRVAPVPPPLPPTGTQTPPVNVTPITGVQTAPPQERPPSPPRGMTFPGIGSNRIDVQLSEDTLRLTPGTPSTIRVTLANMGTTVDHLTLGVKGVPSSWIQGPPQTVQLMNGAQTQVPLIINAPRISDSLARPYNVTVLAHSRENPNESGSAPATWTVLPFSESRLEVKPKRARAWRKADYTAIVTNTGNIPASYMLSGEDDEAALNFDFQDDRATLEPGKDAKVRLRVAGPARWFGSDQLRAFRLYAKPEKGGDDQKSSAQLTQRALFPPWLIPVLLTLLLGGSLYGCRALPVPSTAVTRLYRYGYGYFNPTETPTTDVEATAVVEQQTATAIAAATTLAETYATGTAFAQTETARPVIQQQTANAELTALAQNATASAPPATSAPAVTTAPAQGGTTPVGVTTLPVNTATPAGQVRCKPGSVIAIDGRSNQRLEPFLLYFNGYPVSGGTTAADGSFRGILLIEGVGPGRYPVAIRLRRDRDIVLGLYSFIAGPENSGSLVDDNGRQGIVQLTCVVPVITPIPTPTSGVIVYPPR